MVFRRNLPERMNMQATNTEKSMEREKSRENSIEKQELANRNFCADSNI